MTPERLRWVLAALVVVISSVVVSSAFTTIPHTGGDNAGYIALAHSLVADGSYVDAFDPEGLRHTKYPPVFPALLAMLIALGARTWVALKMTAAVPTVLAVGLTYAFAERRIGYLAAFGLASLLAVSSGIVYYSHWVLSDPLFLVFTVGSLYALSRAHGERHDGERHEEVQAGAPGSDSSASPPCLVVGIVAAGLAYFTRSAGLPLVMAILGWLALQRRWRALSVSGLSLGLPMLAWWIRGRGEGVAQYGTEFWMVNPYDPAQGTISVFGLVPRIIENASSYIFQHGPAGVVGADAPALAPLGLLLAVTAIAGWAVSVRQKIGPAEIFFPLYTGLILVWPSVWGGDRFALPLYPLLFLYGAIALRGLASLLPLVAGRAMLAGALLMVLLPAADNWLDGNRQSATCEAVASERGPWACYGSRVGYFVMAATWTATGLPDDAAVLSRKPRHFYLLSGRPSRAFPFEENVEAHLALADELGARYVLLDRWDGLATRHVGAAVRQRPGAYCYVRGFGQPSEGGAQLLGILPADQRVTGDASPESGVGLSPCPADFLATPGVAEAYSSSGRIPILEELGS